MQDFEKLGVFYLGKVRDAEASSSDNDLLLYESKDLTTHAMIVGMTGSGKTGLALGMIEEAAIDGVPALLIDPKGDLGNLLLQFPELRTEDFRPWIDEAEATRKGLSPDEHAAATAKLWRNGLAKWGQDGDRIRRLLNTADLALYTPGNTAGRPIRLLRSFTAPPPEIAEDASAMRDHVMFAVSGLLGLIGISEDPVQCREHILLSAILDASWRAGHDVELEELIRLVQKPPFEQVGVFDLETFYPAKDRLKLAMSLNHLLASPGFSAWREGAPLDIERLLYTREGKPRAAVLSIAHLSDAERMFFVTALLNEVITWMRRQSGTSSLRAILYMDEIFGYFPPSANPPSKAPMLTLLKQARAYGLGVVLSTQNPVDLDYKGLGNCGTWFIGRLQTERDKMRVLDGLEGSADGSGATFDRAQTDRLLSGLGNRVFLMRNVHDDAPVLFETRWVMSYLSGPMTLPQLRMLTQPDEPTAAPTPVPAQTPAYAIAQPTVAAPVPQPAAPSSYPAAAASLTAANPPAVPAPATSATAPAAARPILPTDMTECFLRAPGGASAYTASVTGSAKLHFVDAKTKTDIWVTRSLLAPLDALGTAQWENAVLLEDAAAQLDAMPMAGSVFHQPPAGALTARSTATWERTFKLALYQEQVLELLTCPELKMVAKPGETEEAFRARVAFARREVRDVSVEKLKTSYAPKIQRLTDQLRRAEERVGRQKAQVKQQRMNTALSVGATVLGALVGRRAASVGTVGRATTAMRSAGRIGKDQASVEQATENAEVLKQRLDELERQFERELEALKTPFDASAQPLDRVAIRPRKTDIVVTNLALCWRPV